MNATENKNIVLTFFEKMSSGDMDTALELMDENITYIVSGNPEQFPLAGTYRNKKEVIDMLMNV